MTPADVIDRARLEIARFNDAQGARDTTLATDDLQRLQDRLFGPLLDCAEAAVGVQADRVKQPGDRYTQDFVGIAPLDRQAAALDKLVEAGR